MSIYVVDSPTISFRLAGAASILDRVNLYPIIDSIIDNAVADLCLLPKRIAIPIDPLTPIARILRPRPRGVLTLRVLRAENLRGDDAGLPLPFFRKAKTSDPYVKLQLGASRFRTPTVWKNCDPVWEKHNSFSFIVDEPVLQVLY